MAQTHTVLVTGATGKQGGAVVDALLERGHTVLALTRSADSAAAQALAARGVGIVLGSFEDPASIVAAAKGADTGFLMGNFNGVGAEGEVRQGVAGATAMQQAGIGHLIYSSVASADRQTGIPHFDSKYEVEKQIAGLGIPYTISAPVAFMENAVAPWAIGALKQGKLAFILPRSRKLQQIATVDIGGFVASLVERREAVFGKRFDIAGDDLTGSEEATILSEVIGKPIAYQEIPLETVRAQNAETAIMAEWFDRVGYAADIAALRRDFSEVNWHSFADWAKTIDWSGLDASSAAA